MKNELNSNKNNFENPSNNFHIINLLKLTPNLKQKLTNDKLKISKVDKKIGISLKNSINSNNNKEKMKIKIKQNGISLINNPNFKIINNISIIKDPSASLNTEKISTKKENTKIKVENNLNSLDEFKGKTHKDPVIAFFNRNFYSCEVPVSKKISDNQKILDYYLKDKETKEKYKQLLILKKLEANNNKNRIRNINSKNNSYKKNDIKQSLMLDDFRLYNRIHRVVRFWSRFINYACPIFQVQKFALNSQRLKNERNLNLNHSMENLNQSFKEKNNKLPKLYTNSSKVFKIGENKEYKFFPRSRSNLDNTVNQEK